MALTAIQVFENTVYGIGKELIKENVDVFNGHSNGAIVLSSKSIQGDFEQRLDLTLGSDLIKARNPYADTELSAKNFDRVKDNVVKLGLGTHPIEWTNAEFNWVKQNPELAGAKIARAIANQSTKYMAEVGIGSVVTCLNTNANVKTTIPNSRKIDHNDLIQAVRPMGDQFNSVALYIMHSTQYFDLLGTTFKNAERLFDFGGITVMQSALGQRFLITDNKALTSTQADYTVGLKKGSVLVGHEQDFDSVYTKTGGRENIKHQYQAEWTSSLKVANYRYKTSDTMNGLSYSAITTGNNWERISNETKDETGVIIVNAKA